MEPSREGWKVGWAGCGAITRRLEDGVGGGRGGLWSHHVKAGRGGGGVQPLLCCWLLQGRLEADA